MTYMSGGKKRRCVVWRRAGGKTSLFHGVDYGGLVKSVCKNLVSNVIQNLQGGENLNLQSILNENMRRKRTGVREPLIVA
jgi:hypothetical protein